MAKTHGMRKTPVWGVWWQMLQRCRNPNVKAYPRYGGRGIKVCVEWQQFENFYRDMGDPPDGHSLDRIDTNGDYTPCNCRWATPLQQAENRRVTQMIEWCGVRKSAAAWDALLGFSKGTTSAKLKAGWPIEDAMLPKAYINLEPGCDDCECKRRPLVPGEGLCVLCGLPPGYGRRDIITPGAKPSA